MVELPCRGRVYCQGASRGCLSFPFPACSGNDELTFLLPFPVSHPFHPLLRPSSSLQFATHTHVFPYTNAKRQEGGGADEFGVDSRAQLMLVPWEKFGEIVEGMEGFVAATA